MSRIRYVLAGVLIGVFLTPALSAQNREHLQMFADMRMLQEQVQRLQLAVNALNEQLKTTTATLDTQETAMRKDFADLKSKVDGISDTMNTLRERLNDSTTRSQSVIQEVESLREGQSLLQTLLNQVLQRLPPGAGDSAILPGAGSSPPPSGGAPASSQTLPPSPNELYTQGFGLYAAGNYDLAVQVFGELLQRYPNASQAPMSQYLVGESYFQLGRYKDALTAFTTVTTTYRDSDRVAEAYYKQGQTHEQLKQMTEARRIYSLIVERFKGTNVATQAQERLKAIGGGRD
jgi:tol-pal system protein YbgF